MIISETIPSVLTWEEIYDHCRLYDSSEQTYLEGVGLAVVQAFELETGLAVGERTQTITYSRDDLRDDSLRISLPKGPVISVTSVTLDGEVIPSTSYELRKIGKNWYLKFDRSLWGTVVVVLTVGHSTAPALIKQGLLNHLEDMYRNRGATSTAQSYGVEYGLKRIYELYKVNKIGIG